MTDDTATPRTDPAPRTDASTAPRRLEPASRHDLRGTDASAAHDRSAHRRATWLYDDLLS